MLPAAGVGDGLAAPHAGGAVEVEELAGAGAGTMLEDEVAIEEDGLDLGEPVDLLRRDEDVEDWLLLAGLAGVPESVKRRPGELLRKTHQLREIALKAIQARKMGKRPSFDALNSFLEHAASYTRLVMRNGSRIQIKKAYSGRTVEACLAPIAESLADLLANGDFDLVRMCKGDKCILWFYDRTKAHRRKWCSPTECGNRAKVAAFRARSRDRTLAN